VVFSELELLASYRFKSTKPVLIDVGAHHGSFSRVFAEKRWRVIAFEPEPRNRAAYERNLAEFAMVSCFAKAVSDVTKSKVPFYISREHYGIHSLKPFHGTHRLAHEVNTIRLDEILKELQVPEVTLLKIDTEGADFLALKGFDFEAYHPELVIMEFMDDRSMPYFGYTHHDVVAYMEERGYMSFVSEWAPIKEYGREGIEGEPHTWLRCMPYPLDHDPAWGNLIFISHSERDRFKATLESYRKRKTRTISLHKIIAKIPGAKGLYNILIGRRLQ
jgi:FkbM family methyltransferase